MRAQSKASRTSRSVRVGAVGVVVGLVAALVAISPANADASFTSVPTRLYMAPAGTILPAGIPGLTPLPVPPIGALVFDGTDLISMQSRAIEVAVDADPCNFGSTFDITGCTSVQLSIGNGLLDFTGAITANDTDAGTVYTLPGGSIVRDHDPSAYPAPAVALLGTAEDLNEDLKLLRFTPNSGYVYTGSNPANLEVTVTAQVGGSINQTVEVRVLEPNGFPDFTVPATVYQVDAGASIDLEPEADWTATDDDNSDLFGAGEGLLLIAWASCGQFEMLIQGTTLGDNIPALLDAIPGSAADEFGAALETVLPDAVAGLSFSTGPGPGAAFAALVDSPENLAYNLGNITFTATDPVTDADLPPGICDLRFFVTDLGYHGLPLSYIGAPPAGFEVPFFGIDTDTNDDLGVELVQVQVGEDVPIEVTVGDVVVDEGGVENLPVTISPATHPGFDLMFSTGPGTGAVAGSDYTEFTGLGFPVPQDATSLLVPVDALTDAAADPGETYTVTATGPASDPIGFAVTLVDAAGLVTITDVPPPDDEEPTVTINQTVGQADPTSTSPILFDIVFSEPVTGFTNTDIVLSGSANPTTAVISPLTATSYMVEVSGMSADGLVIAEVFAGSAEDAAGNLSEASTSDDNQVTYDYDEGDTTNPTVTINQTVGQADPTSTSPILFDIVFSEPVTGFTNTDIVLSGSANPTTAVISPLTATSYMVEVSGMSADGLVIAEVFAGSAEDAAGNLSEASTSDDNQVTYDYDEGDTTNPTVTINQTVGQADPTSTSPILFDIVFSEPVTGFTNTDIVLSGSANPTTAVISPLTATSYMVEVSGMSADGLVIAEVFAGSAEDAAGNLSEASTSDDNQVTYDYDEGDTTNPTVTINQGSAQPDPVTTLDPIVFDVVFSEPVTGFDSPADVILSGTAGATTAAITPISAITYTVTVTGMTGEGTVIASIPADIATDTSPNANPNQASTSDDNQVTIEFEDAPDPLAIDVPDDIVVNAPPGESGVAVTFADPVVTGGVPPTSFSCTHASGDVFPIGVTTVECTASDSGEIMPLAMVSDTFTITVNETTDPGDGGDGDGDGDGGSNGGSGSGSGTGSTQGNTPLPATGVDTTVPITLAAGLLLAGFVMLRIARRARITA